MSFKIDSKQAGRTALHVACETGHWETVDLLISRGASREARDNSGRTPLHQAAVHRHTELVKVLLEAGCNVDATDNVILLILSNNLLFFINSFRRYFLFVHGTCIRCAPKQTIELEHQTYVFPHRY